MYTYIYIYIYIYIYTNPLTLTCLFFNHTGERRPLRPVSGTGLTLSKGLEFARYSIDVGNPEP